MQRAFALGMLILITGLLLLARPDSQAKAVPSPGSGGFKWEYKVYTEVDLANLSEAKTLEDSLNKLGEEGWELVAIKAVYETPAAAAKKNSQALFVLKRLKTGK